MVIVTNIQTLKHRLAPIGPPRSMGIKELVAVFISVPRTYIMDIDRGKKEKEDVVGILPALTRPSIQWSNLRRSDCQRTRNGGSLRR
jgi:hypothetical protein